MKYKYIMKLYSFYGIKLIERVKALSKRLTKKLSTFYYNIVKFNVGLIKKKK